MIKLQNLCCFYEEQIILENITQEFPRHLSILGPNGSGKSTLAKAICLLTPYHGEISLDGTEIRSYTAKERAKKIAYIPTKLEFYDEFLTVEEFVLLGRFAYKKSFFDYSDKERSLVKQYMGLLHIMHLCHQKLNSLSSGETALVLMAQALTQESQLIIFDEPTANLDPKNAKIIARHIKQLQQTHQTVLITHDIHLAHFMNNPVLFLKNQNTHYFEKEFFSDENLSKLYDVNIKSLAVEYD